MRGYFGMGVERISKAMNMGAIMRTAHAFGAGFAVTEQRNLLNPIPSGLPATFAPGDGLSMGTGRRMPQ